MVKVFKKNLGVQCLKPKIQITTLPFETRIKIRLFFCYYTADVSLASSWQEYKYKTKRVEKPIKAN